MTINRLAKGTVKNGSSEIVTVPCGRRSEINNMKKGFLIIFTFFYFGLFIILIDLVSRNFIGPLPGVLTLAALVAAFILSVGLAQFTANKAEVLAPLKRKLLLAIVCLLLILAVIVVFVKAKGKKPFQDLEAADISAASVELVPPDTTVQITDLEELAGYLNDIVVYEKDNSYNDYAGQTVTITLTMKDGSKKEIRENNSFVVIDGTGYKAKYEPLEALSHYANSLREALNSMYIANRIYICYNAGRQSEISSPCGSTAIKTPVLQHWGFLFPFCRQGLGPRLVTDYLSLSNHLMM